MADERRNGPAFVLQKRDRRRGQMRHIQYGEMAERSNAAVLKTVVRLPANRGFESLFLRKVLINPASGGVYLFDRGPVESLLSKGAEGK